MSRAQNAKDYFNQGYSCSQAVVKAFSDVIDNAELLIKVASSFGGGFGRLREVCGAFSGMCIVLGATNGYDERDIERKMEYYALIRELAEQFKNVNGGSVVCRELIKGTEKLSSENPSVRTEEYKQKRPCQNIVYNATEIIEKTLIEKGIL